MLQNKKGRISDLFFVQKEGLEPSRCYSYGPEPYASANSAISAKLVFYEMKAHKNLAICVNPLYNH